MLTVVQPGNLVSVPESVATQLGIGPGTRLEWMVDAAGVLTVRTISRAEIFRSLLGAGRPFLSPGDDPIAELIRERELDDEIDRENGY